MLALGLVSILQLTCVPGYLALKLAGWSHRSLLQLWVYIFAVSIIVNYCLVYTLVSLECYYPTVVYAFLVLEASGGLWLLSKRSFDLRSRLGITEAARSCFQNLELQRLPPCIFLGLAAAGLISYAYLSYKSFGSVFTLWDDAVSWDRWAEQWVANRFPSEVGFYPQMIPANWSLTYVILRSTDVKMFAKALMPLFPIATFLLFLDLALRRKSPQYLLSIAIYGQVLYVFLGEALIVSGYMETALPFFGLLAVYALLELSETGPSVANVLLASLFAAATGLVKQGGLYMLPLCAVWTSVVLYQRRRAATREAPGRRVLPAAAAGVFLALPWYLRQYLAMRTGAEQSNISYLASLAAQGRSHFQVVSGAFAMVYNARGGFAKPLCWFLAGTCLLSLFDRTARWVFLWVLALLVALWALFFSYEVRTASLIFPFLALSSGAGVGVLLRSAGLLSKSPVEWNQARTGRAYLWGSVCVLAVSVVLCVARIRDAVFGAWQRDMMGEMTRWWGIPLGLSAIVILLVVALSKRQWAFTVHWHYLAAAAVWIWMSTTTGRSSDIVQQQIELQKNIDDVGLNHKLYDYMAGAGIQGLIATDYWVLGRLPVLKRYYKPQFFPDNTSADFLAMVAKAPGVCYILVAESELADQTRAALAQGLYRSLWTEGRRRFIRTCGPPAVSPTERR